MMLQHALLLPLLLMLLCEVSQCGADSNDCDVVRYLKESNHYLLSQIIPCGYIKEHPPANDPVEVECALYVQDINSINPRDMDFRIDLILHLSWEDNRLNLNDSDFVEGDDTANYIPLPSYALDYIWVPDPYITNSKDAAITSLTTVYASLTIHRNNTLRYSARIYSLIACQMAFQKYPMDVQTCPVSLQSFKHSTKEMLLSWRYREPVSINPELKLLQFTLEKNKHYSANTTLAELGGYSHRQIAQLTVEFKFSRLIGYHVVQTFVPSFLVVSLTWFSFWIGLDAIPGRCTLLVTSMLSLITLFTGIKNDLPAVAYIKAIDIWMAGCILFAFAAVGEFVICKVIKGYHDKCKNKVAPMPLPPIPKSNAPTFPSPVPPQDQTATITFTNNNTIGTPITFRRPLTWPPPEDVEKGVMEDDDVPPSKITKLNGKEIDLSRSVSESGSVPGYQSNNREGSTNNKKRTRGAVEEPRKVKSAINEWDKILETKAKRRKKWLKTMRDLEMQWDDPKTGDVKILWEEIDSMSRIVFPVIFFVFAAIYFPFLMLL